MATPRGRMALSYLTAALTAGALTAAANPQETLRANAAAQRLMAQRTQLGLDADADFQLRSSHTDRLGQSHAHFQQTYKGIRVWGGDAITHVDREGNPLPLTDALKRNILLNITPSLGADEALSVAHRDLSPQGAYAYAPTSELVVVPEMVDVVRPRGPRALDREINADGHHPPGAPLHPGLPRPHRAGERPGRHRHTDYLIDAHTGAILKTWNTLHTTAATGTGNSQYSGTVSLHTNATGSLRAARHDPRHRRLLRQQRGHQHGPRPPAPRPPAPSTPTPTTPGATAPTTWRAPPPPPPTARPPPWTPCSA